MTELPDPEKLREEIEHIIYTYGGYTYVAVEDVIRTAIDQTLAWVEEEAEHNLITARGVASRIRAARARLKEPTSTESSEA